MFCGACSLGSSSHFCVAAVLHPAAVSWRQRRLRRLRRGWWWRWRRTLSGTAKFAGSLLPAAVAGRPACQCGRFHGGGLSPILTFPASSGPRAALHDHQSFAGAVGPRTLPLSVMRPRHVTPSSTPQSRRLVQVRQSPPLQNGTG